MISFRYYCSFFAVDHMVPGTRYSLQLYSCQVCINSTTTSVCVYELTRFTGQATNSRVTHTSSHTHTHPLSNLTSAGDKKLRNKQRTTSTYYYSTAGILVLCETFSLLIPVSCVQSHRVCSPTCLDSSLTYKAWLWARVLVDNTYSPSSCNWLRKLQCSTCSQCSHCERFGLRLRPRLWFSRNDGFGIPNLSFVRAVLAVVSCTICRIYMWFFNVWWIRRGLKQRAILRWAQRRASTAKHLLVRHASWWLAKSIFPNVLLCYRIDLYTTVVVVFCDYYTAMLRFL